MKTATDCHTLIQSHVDSLILVDFSSVAVLQVGGREYAVIDVG
jgi:hypothetical protein